MTTIRTNASDRQTFESLVDLDRSHKHVMSLLPDGMGLFDDARAAMGVLFRVDFPERLASGDIVLRVQSAVQIDATSVPVPALHLGDEIVLGTRLATIIRSQGKERAVPEKESDAWVLNALSRSGFEVLDSSLSKPRFRGQRGGIGFTGRDVVAKARVSDESAANDAVLNGIGRGKSYGYGLVLFSKVAES